MAATPTLPSSRLRALGLLLLLPLLGGWRPYDSVDGPVTPTGQLAIEWGAMSVQLKQPQLTLAVPQVLVRLGVTQKLELGLRGNYRFVVDHGAPWDRGDARGTVGAYGKVELISGSGAHANAPRPAISLLAGADFLTDRALWALEARGAGSLLIGPVLTHINLGFRYDQSPGVLVGAVIALPLSVGFTPAVEVSGEIRFTPNSSLLSVLLGFSQRLGRHPFTLDVSARRGLTAATTDWTAQVGLTMHFPIWRPQL